VLYHTSDDCISLGDGLENLVYVVGVARGGSSLLFRALGVKEDIYQLPGMSHFYSNVWRNRECMHDRLFSLVYSDLLKWFDIRGAIAKLSNHQGESLKDQYLRAILDRDFKKLYKLYPLVSTIVSANEQSNNYNYWLDKSNDWRGLRTIKNNFNNGKFVFIVRDPRSVVLSGSIRAAKKQCKSSRDVDDIVSQTLSWVWMVDRFLTFYKNNQDISIIVRYEDLIDSPCDCVNKVFNFITGSTISENDLIEKLDSVRGGASNSSDVYCGISSSSLDRWKNDLSGDEVKIVESIASRVMQLKEVNYTLSNDSSFFYGGVSMVGVRNFFKIYLRYFISRVLSLFGI